MGSVQKGSQAVELRKPRRRNQPPQWPRTRPVREKWAGEMGQGGRVGGWVGGQGTWPQCRAGRMGAPHTFTRTPHSQLPTMLWCLQGPPQKR